MPKITYLYNICLNVKDKDSHLVSLKVYDLLLTMKQNLETSQIELLDNKGIKAKAIKKYIETQYKEDISLEMVSQVADCTKQYTCKLFKQYYGVRPIEYLNRLRVNQSMQLLLNESHIKVSEIGHLVGYRGPSYFGAVFKKQVGMTPLQYRETYNYLN